MFKADSANWLCTTRRLTKDLHFLDNGDAHSADNEYLMCLRSNHLILRWADVCIAEPYTPHRFSRQFSYYQDGSSGILGHDEREVTLSEGFRRWRHFTLRGSGSRVTFPATRVTVTMKKYFSPGYKDWWAQVHGDYLERNIKGLAPEDPANMQQEVGTAKKGKHPVQGDEPPPKKRKEHAISKKKADVVRSDSGDEESRDRHWKRRRDRRSPSPVKDNVAILARGGAESSNKRVAASNTGESRHSNNASASNTHQSGNCFDEPHTGQQDRPEVSVFDGKDLVLEEFRVVVINVWNKLRKKLDETSVEHVSSLQENFMNAFANLRKLDIDISPLETRVVEIFAKAQAFDNLRSTISDKTLGGSQSLSSAKDELKNAQDKFRGLKKDLLDQHKMLKTAKDREEELEKELKLARAKVEECDTAVAKITDDLGNAKTAVSEAEAEVTRIKELTVLTPEDEVRLKEAKRGLEACKDDMLSFRLFTD